MTDGDGTDKQPLAGDCASAFLLLSRIPVTWYSFPDDRPPDFISSLWAFPLVGLVIGGSGGLVMLAGQLLTLPPVVAARAWHGVDKPGSRPAPAEPGGDDDGQGGDKANPNYRPEGWAPYVSKAKWKLFQSYGDPWSELIPLHCRRQVPNASLPASRIA